MTSRWKQNGGQRRKPARRGSSCGRLIQRTDPCAQSPALTLQCAEPPFTFQVWKSMTCSIRRGREMHPSGTGRDCSALLFSDSVHGARTERPNSSFLFRSGHSVVVKAIVNLLYWSFDSDIHLLLHLAPPCNRLTDLSSSVGKLSLFAFCVLRPSKPRATAFASSSFFPIRTFPARLSSMTLFASLASREQLDVLARLCRTPSRLR